MKILQIAPPWFAVPPVGYGGIEHVIATLVDGLAQRGCDVTLLAAGTSRTRGTLWSTMEEVPSERLGDPVVELSHVLEGFRRSDEFDIVHDHTLSGAALGAVARDAAVVHTLHGPWTSAMAQFYRQISDRVHLVAISHDQASRTPPKIDVAAVVHNGIDVKSHPFNAAKEPHLAFVGRANPDKGPETAINVARRLNLPLRMAIKVNEQAERDYFNTCIAPIAAQGDVEIVENADVNMRNDIVTRASALLFPIQWPEPFGLVPLEANASGTPVVAFAQGAAPEVVADGVSGFLVEPGNVDAFCAAVEQVGRIDSYACRQHAYEHFDASRMVAGYISLYERILGRDTSHLSKIPKSVEHAVGA